MRIHSLRFRNLASLAGEWNLDFSHPAYAAHGIFAITGPTGAGKSTILDAICLALYGQTPRLGKIAQKQNEIMSRHCHECFAEVVFETRQGRFLCRWSQVRANKSARGNLRPAKHVLQALDAHGNPCDAETVEGLGSERKTEVLAQVEELTGLDFHRFTRSMLLAQGDFAAFMQAGTAERALLLENITGTGIYADISRLTFERHAAEKDTLNRLEVGLSGLIPLSDEERAELAAQLNALTGNTQAAREQSEHLREAVQWLDRHTENTRSRTENQRLQAVWQTEHATFAPQAAQLALARQALELAPMHSALTGARSAHEETRQALTLAQNALPALEQAEQTAKTARAEAENRHVRQVTEEQQAAPLIQQVRGIDLSLRERRTALQADSQAVEERRAALLKLVAEQTVMRSEQETAQREQADLFRQLEATAAHAGLPARLSGVQADIRTALELVRRQEQGRTVNSSATTTALQTERQATAAAHRHAALQQGLVPEEARLATLQNAHTALLDGQELAHWRGAAQALTLRVASLTTMSSHLTKFIEQDLIARQMRSELATQAPMRLEVNNALLRDQALLPEQEELVTQLERIKTLEDHRAALQTGQACPLCGSQHHPFAMEAPALPDAARERLAQTRENLRKNQEEDHRLAMQANTLQARQKQAEEQSAEQMRELLAAWETLDMPDAFDPRSPEAQNRLTTLLDAAREQQQQATTRLAELDAMEADINRQRALVERRRRDAAEAERHALSTAAALEAALRDQKRLAAELKELGEALRLALEHLATEIAIHRIDFSDEQAESSPALRTRLDTLSVTVDQLATQRDQREKRHAAIQAQLSALSARLEEADKNRAAEEARVHADDQQLAERRTAVDALSRERLNLFGDRQPDTEAARLSAATAQARAALDAAIGKQDTTGRALAMHRSAIATHSTTLAEREAAVTLADEAFRTRLAHSPFADEPALTAALLPPEQRHALELRETELAETRARLDALRVELEASLTRLDEARQRSPHLATLLNGLDREQAQAALEQVNAQLSTLTQQSGALAQRLRDDDACRESRQERLTALLAQREECARWARLQALIGSKNGNVYRNFVQSLTFAALLEHANRQLTRMTDRYTLVPHGEDPLALNVIDHYQAGEERSAVNLSGGETFLVSLALALGLSGMVSRRVRVDSLFLDEGFGTLDEDALDMALETLGSLQREGKLIGVISHVPALKERMGVRIEVYKHAGGRSSLKGAGCTGLG